jgi:hypothetical protein
MENTVLGAVHLHGLWSGKVRKRSRMREPAGTDSVSARASPMLVVCPGQSEQKTTSNFSRMRESRATAPAAASLGTRFCEGDKELSNSNEMSCSPALYRPLRGNSLLARKNPCIFPARAEKNSLLARADNFVARPWNLRLFLGAPLPRLKEPRRLRHLDRHDPASGSSRLQCRI